MKENKPQQKVFWILNKYIGHYNEEDFYWLFLKETKKHLYEKGIDLKFISFNPIQKDKLEVISFKEKNNNSSHIDELFQSINKIEQKFNFTFSQAEYSDVLQVSDNKNRTIYPKTYKKQEGILKLDKFNFLNDIIDLNTSMVMSDISPELEIELAKYICFKKNIPFIRSADGSVFGQTPFFHLKPGNNENLIKIKVNNFSRDEIIERIQLFKNFKAQPYKPYSGIPKTKSLFSRIISTKVNDFFKKIQSLSFKIFLFFENIHKRKLYNEFKTEPNYFFHAFHLVDESTITLRAQPFSNQFSLVEMISRVLPSGYVLYIREHPHWPEEFSYKFLKKFKKLENVMILSPKISIHDILKDSNGVITYNNTTGLEALLYAKPVLSFSNSLYNFYDGVKFCKNVYEIPQELISLSHKKVDSDKVTSMFQELINCSLPFTLGSYNFNNDNYKKNSLQISDFIYQSLNHLTKNVN